MKLKAFTLLLGSALVAIAGCSTTSQTAKRANPAPVENIAPVHVSKNVSIIPTTYKMTYSRDYEQLLGEIKLYGEVILPMW